MRHHMPESKHLTFGIRKCTKEIWSIESAYIFSSGFLEHRGSYNFIMPQKYLKSFLYYFDKIYAKVVRPDTAMCYTCERIWQWETNRKIQKLYV